MFDRVLVVGYGSIGQRHLRIIRAFLPNADIRLLRHQPSTSTPQEANGCFCALSGACAFAPQATVIANPATYHVETALALAAVGSHLLIEKPLAHDSVGVPVLLQCAMDMGVTLQVGYNLRYLPSLIEFRTLIQDGAIGRILSVRCETGQYLPSWRPDADYRACVSAQRALGGGVLLELSHELDYLRWIFGEVAWVNAWLGQQSDLEIDIEDTAHLILGFFPDAMDRGSVAAVSLDFVRQDTTRTCTAIGDQGSLRWNGLTGQVDLMPVGHRVWQTLYQNAYQQDDSYRDQWRDFLAWAPTGRPAGASGADGLAVLRIIDCARQSATQYGKRVITQRNPGAHDP